MGQSQPTYFRRAVARLLFVLSFGSIVVACASGVPQSPPADALPEKLWPAEGTTRAVVVAMHGFNDYRNAFEEFAQDATAAGITVYAYDHAGFGANPDAGYWPGRDVLVNGALNKLATIKARFPDVPVYLLGESMGGAIAVITATEPGAAVRPDGVILVAPAVWSSDQMPWYFYPALRVASFVAPNYNFQSGAVDVQPTDNLDELREMAQDPLVIKTARIEPLFGTLQLMNEAVARAPQLQGPLLTLSGEKDEIIPPFADKAWRAKLDGPRCTNVVYPEGWHMLFRDLQGERVRRDTIQWILTERPREPDDLPSDLAQSCDVTTAEAD